MAEKWPQKRYIGANYAKRFQDLPAYLEGMASSLSSCCECDGRGCTMCISSEALKEAAEALRQEGQP